MKKPITIVLFLILINTINAQELNPANRTKSALNLTRKSTVTMNSKYEVMGQDMDNNMKTTTVYNIEISPSTEQGATAEMKTIAVKIETNAFGQEEMNYDSEKPEEGSRELAAQVKDMMKNILKITLDQNGNITSVKGNEKLASNKNEFGNSYEKGEMFYVFFKLPKSINPGDSWELKEDRKEYKATGKYTYKSFENGIANIEIISTITMDQKIEQMGMIMFSTLEGTTVETIEVDPSTLLIKSRNSISNLKGFVDARGNKMPIYSFITTSETIQ